MNELRVSLEFDCCDCNELVGVTVQCAGKGLALVGSRSVARVNVPCPGCGAINQVFFEPHGTVRAVQPYAICRSAVPSTN